MMINERKEMVSFCVVIPAYNEQQNIARCVLSLDEFLGKLDRKTSIIVVNDGSTDQTGIVLEQLKSQTKNLLIETHQENRGYGAANITGGKRAYTEGFDYALFMDADLTQNVNYIYPFLAEMANGIDFIKATRYAKGGGVNGVPFKRVIVSWVGNLLARMLLRLPISDYTNGFRAIKTGIISQIECREKGFAYLVEEVSKVSRIAKSYAEVPYILTIREDKFSKSKFRYNPKVYYNYLKYLFKH